MKNVWTAFVAASDVPPGTIGSGFRKGQEIAVVNDNGKLYAMSNKLPPTGQPATLGKLETLNGQRVIVDTLSGSCFSLKTGKPTGPWCPSTVGRLIIGRLVSPTDVPVCESPPPTPLCVHWPLVLSDIRLLPLEMLPQIQYARTARILRYSSMSTLRPSMRPSTGVGSLTLRARLMVAITEDQRNQTRTHGISRLVEELSPRQ